MDSEIKGNDDSDSTLNGKADRISSKFTWDKKTILWEIENISEAVGRKNYLLPDKCNDHIEDSLSSSDQQSPIQYHSLMDIDCIHSTHFNAGAHEENKSTWSMALYKQENFKYLGLSLHLLEIESESPEHIRYHQIHTQCFEQFEKHGYHTLYIKYSMSIISPTGSILHRIENPSIISLVNGNTWKEDNFLQVDKLWDPSNYYIPDDTLRIQLDLHIFHQLAHTIKEREINPPQELEKVENLTGGSEKLMRELWTKRGFTDVTIQCGDRLFPVHKCIIAASSPVFQAMFLNNNFTEASQNQVKIVDTDPTTLEVMLEFLYTEKIPETWNWEDFDGVSQLLNVCEKYQVQSMKTFCLKMICDRIEITNAGEIVVLFHLYNAEQFAKDLIYNFISRNLKVLKKREGFCQLVNSKPAAFTPILLSKALSDLI